jgi:hypothetical protein
MLTNIRSYVHAFDDRRASYDHGMVATARYRCSACGNLTRFDVVTARRSRAFHHYSIGGELQIEEEEVLEERVERVSCRWCGATGAAIEVSVSDAEQLDDQAS